MYKLKVFDIPYNFGDMLSTYILDYFGVNYTVVNEVGNANLFTVGSIARIANENSTVIGSGIIRNGENLKPSCKWLAVRGPLTRKRVLECGGKCSEVYGDPALLLPKFVKPSKKKYEVAIIPHYKDYGSVVRRYGEKYKIINVVNKNPIDVVKEISSCEKTICSSLHGIIVSHAYGVPSARFIGGKIHGDGIKFEDYFLSIGRKCITSTIKTPKYIECGSIDLGPLEDVFVSIKE